MLILANDSDPVARNIRDHLLGLWNHETIGNYEGLPIFKGKSGKTELASIPISALELDNPYTAIFPSASPPDIVMYLSRHQSVSGNKSLTVHPIGNFSKAEYGGRERTLVPATPHIMTSALRILSGKEVEGYECTFEATHHGPFNDVPTFFIEIGSTLEAWNDPVAVRAVAETVLEIVEMYETTGIEQGKTCIGLGGGHYAPRHTKYALKEGLDFGHIVPSYAGKHLDIELAEEVIRKTPGIELVCAHGKKHRKEERVFRELGIEVIEY